MLHPTTSIRRRGGFTLVELLVVIAILGILAGLLIAVVPGVFSSSNRKVALTEIRLLADALSTYEAHFNDYPPTKLGIGGSNGINEGIESLVACLSSKIGTGPYHAFEDTDRLLNLDKDKASGPLSLLMDSTFTTADLFELTDPFGNPYVYFHGDDLAPETVGRYHIAGQVVDCQPGAPDKTGRYPGYGKYQIISAGPDGKYEGGGGDDVTSWKSD